MRRLLIAVVLGFASVSAFGAACVVNLVPPTSLVSICQDTSGNIVFTDASGVGPITLKSAGAGAGLATQGQTLAQLGALSPPSAGLLYYCSNCVSTPICVSTGTAVGQFAAVAVSTGATTGLGACK